MRSHGVFNDKDVRPIAVDTAPAELYLSGLGMTGYTAYFGMMDIGRPQPDETVVVSAAAGAVGSIAAQLAKMRVRASLALPVARKNAVI